MESRRDVVHARGGRKAMAGVGAATALATLVAGAAAGVPAASASRAHKSSHLSVSMSVADESAFISLPVVLAQRLGYYAKEGLNVSMSSAKGGAEAADALVSGSADTAVVAFDTLLSLDSKKVGYASFATLCRYYTGILVAAPGDKSITSVKSLAHTTIGITSPGSSSERFVDYLLARHGVNPKSVSFVSVGVGSTALAALTHHEVSAAFLLQPDLTILEAKTSGHVKVLTNTQTAAGDVAAFGNRYYPSTVLAAKATWLESHAAAARRLDAAISRTMTWIRHHSAAQIADKMPASYYSGQKATYVKALATIKASYSSNGKMPRSAAATVNRVLVKFLPGYSGSHVALRKTFTNAYFK